MERLPRYKSFFEEEKKGPEKAPSVPLKEKFQEYYNTMEYLRMKLSEVAAPAPAPAPVAAPAAPVEEQETADDVVKKGLSNMAVSILKDYGFESDAIDKIIKMAREFSNPAPEAAPAEEAPAEDNLGLDLGNDTTDTQDQASDEDLLGLGDETAPAEEPAPEEETPEEEVAPTEETPEEVAPAEEPEAKKKSQPEVEKDLDLDDEATQPLDLADFSFKA